VSFEWGSTSGKELEKFSDRSRFLAEWNLLDYHKSRWKLMGILAIVPSIKSGIGNRIVRILFIT
jgi:hypothetical protein